MTTPEMPNPYGENDTRVRFDYPKVTTMDIIRLTQSEYRKLLAQMPALAIDHQATPQETGFKLGVAYVLDKLRNGWVTE